MEAFEPTLTKTEQKGLEKHYVYNVSVMPISGAAKAYKTLVKTAFRKVQNWHPQNLIKHVVYGGF